jgi:signal transduction histidine kinase
LAGAVDAPTRIRVEMLARVAIAVVSSARGVGIGADQLPFVFDMFMQAEVPIERSGTGLGIGLALVKNLVEMHGGTVQAHSAGAGHGSEFVVHLRSHTRQRRRSGQHNLTNRWRPRPPVASSWSMTIGTPPSRSPCS